jgi:hypothetical protein
MARLALRTEALRFSSEHERVLLNRLGKAADPSLLRKLASIAAQEAADVAKVETKKAALERHVEAARALRQSADRVVSSMEGMDRLVGGARNLGFLPTSAASTFGDLMSPARSRRIALPTTWAEAANAQETDLLQFAKVAKRVRGIAEHWEKAARTRFAHSEREWTRRVRMVATRRVAAALREAGIRLTKSTDGIFAAVLAVVHETAQVAVPVGIYRDIAAALPKPRTTRRP